MFAIQRLSMQHLIFYTFTRASINIKLDKQETCCPLYVSLVLYEYYGFPNSYGFYDEVKDILASSENVCVYKPKEI